MRDEQLIITPIKTRVKADSLVDISGFVSRSALNERADINENCIENAMRIVNNQFLVKMCKWNFK